MNTIPSIFSKATPTYTAVGGTERAASTGLSAVLLNRGGRYPRRTQFQELEKIGFDTIVSVEGPEDRYDLEDLISRFPYVRFILLKEPVTLGEQINVGVNELASPLIFVLWNDISFHYGGSAERIAERLFISQKERVGSQSQIRQLCIVPVIQNSRYVPLPTLNAPAFSGDTVRSVAFMSGREEMPTLYPFDGIGIYDRDRFIQLGGFDGSLSSTYWQLMDFGFRAHLWGEEIYATQHIRLSYNGDVPPEDNTTEESYRRFYLRNIAPVFRGDSAYLPWRRFFNFLMRTGGDPFQALSEFSQVRHWVKAYQYRYRSDARSITDLWEDISTSAQDPPEAPKNTHPGDSTQSAACASDQIPSPQERAKP